MDKKVKDWWLDVVATITALFVVGIFIELFKGRLRKWGENLHGYREDGSHREEYPHDHPKHKPKHVKKREPEEEDDDEEPMRKVA